MPELIAKYRKILSKEYLLLLFTTFMSGEDLVKKKVSLFINKGMLPPSLRRPYVKEEF